MSSKHIETHVIRTQIERVQYLEHSNPLFLALSYVFEDAEDMRTSFADEKQRNIYSQYSNPNTSELVWQIAQLNEAVYLDDELENSSPTDFCIGA